MRTALVLTVALVVALSSGCSADPAPPAGPGTATESSGSLAVPAVRDPLDPGRFRDAPCDLLSAEQAAELGLPFAAQERAAGRPTCTWRADETDQSPLEALQIRFQSTSGLTTIAQQCESGAECDSWTVDTISDYPVIRANGRLESKYGLCRLFVGVADDVAFLVSDGDLDTIRQGGAADGDAGGPRCDRADRATTMVIQKLKGGR